MKNLPDGVNLEAGTTAAGGIPETCPKCGAVKSYEIRRGYGPRNCDGVRYRCGRGIYEDGLCEEGSVTCDGVESATPIMDARKALEKANQNEIIGMRQELVTNRQEIAALKVDVALWRKTSGETKDGWDNCANDLAAMRQRAEKAEAERDEAQSKDAAVEEIAALRSPTSHTDWKTGREFAELQSEIIVLKARLQDVQSHLQGVESDRRGILARAEKAEAKIRQLEFYPIMVACDPVHPETYVSAADVAALRERAIKTEREAQRLWRLLQEATLQGAKETP